MELYIVRHGKTIWNAEGRLQGHVDICLNEEGVTAATQLGKQLADIDFDIVYASPLIRAHETAKIIFENRNVPIVTDDRLKELSFGDMEGITTTEWFSESSPYHFFFSEPDKYPTPPNGESLEDVCKRSAEFLKEVIEPQADTANRIMIVAHGALNKGLMCHIQQNDIRHYWGKGLQANCECSIFRFENQKWETVKE